MKLLIDNQLPEALAIFLVANGFDARHVRRLGLGAASDDKIWSYARAEGFAVVTMDDDFQHFAARYGTPPQVVWIRLGNVRKLVLLDAMMRVLPQLRSSLDDGTGVIEIS